MDQSEGVTVVRVRWEELERTPLYEDMVSVVLSRLHPRAERIDGIGGDGGRDVQLRTDGRLDLFELKSFTGRLSARSPDRRRQVEQSLITAAGLQPDSWCLVVPIDHNKDELRWFDGLRKQYPFPLTWHGRTWLDSQMAAFPDIHRFYLADANAEVVGLLRELTTEQTGLVGGVNDAVDRLDWLRSKLNDLDPQYRFELTPGPAEAAKAAFPHAVMYTQQEGEHGPVTISILPKYRDAVRDRPVLIHVRMAFPNTGVGQEAADRFRNFLDYGDPVVGSDHVEAVDIEAPGGLGGMLGPGTLQISPATPREAPAPDARIFVVDEDGTRLASLPLRIAERHRGARGGTIAGHDATGLLRVRLRLDENERRVEVNVQVRPVSGHLPSTLLPLLHLARSLRGPHRVAMTIAGRDLWETPQTLSDQELVTSEYVELVEQLARVQAEANTPFAIPEEVESEDVAKLHSIIRLLDGEPVALRAKSITITLDPDAPRPWQANNNEAGQLALEAEYSETLMGESIPLGKCTIVAGPWRVDEETTPDTLLPHGQTQVRFHPVSDTRTWLRRGGLRGN